MGTDLVDKSGGGTIDSQNIYQAGGFVGVMANVSSGYKSIVMTGDSLTSSGTGAGYYTHIDADSFMMGYSGAQLWLINNNYTKREAFLAAANFNIAVPNGGVNDIISGRTESQVKTAITTFTTKLYNSGIDRVYWATICPATDTSANPVTNESQTIRANFTNGKRQLINASLAAGDIVPIDGICDWAAAVENPENDYLWVAGSSNDGLHPNTTGAALINAYLIANDPINI